MDHDHPFFRPRNRRERAEAYRAARLAKPQPMTAAISRAFRRLGLPWAPTLIQVDQDAAIARWRAVVDAWRGATQNEEFRTRVLDVLRFTGALRPAQGGGIVLELEAPRVAAENLERYRERLEQVASETLEGRPWVRLVVVAVE